MWKLEYPSIHPSIFLTRYHIQGYEEPEVYPSGLIAQGENTPCGQGANPSQRAITNTLSHTHSQTMDNL